jgi:hypothetical protein
MIGEVDSTRASRSRDANQTRLLCAPASLSSAPLLHFGNHSEDISLALFYQKI